MKISFILAFKLIGLTILLSACSEDHKDEISISITDVQPHAIDTNQTYADMQGKGFELNQYQGKRVIVNYWATWCAPCIEEIPSLINAAAILEDENYILLMISDEPLDTIQTFVDENKFDGNFAKLNGYFAGAGIQAVPSTRLLDEQGLEVRRWLGARHWDSAETLAELREM